MSLNSAYNTLDLNKNASMDEIKKAYKKLALKYHPDKNNGDSTMFKKIYEAYEILNRKENIDLESEGTSDDYIIMLSELFSNKRKVYEKSVNVKLSKLYENHIVSIKIDGEIVKINALEDSVTIPYQYGYLMLNVKLVNDTDYKYENEEFVYDKKIGIHEFLNGASYDLILPNGKKTRVKHDFLNKPMIMRKEEGVYIRYTVVPEKKVKGKHLI